MEVEALVPAHLTLSNDQHLLHVREIKVHSVNKTLSLRDINERPEAIATFKGIVSRYKA